MVRTCIKCGVEKPIEEFLKENTKDGRGHRCKECVRKYVREYHHRNKERLNERAKQRYIKDKTPYLLRSKRQRKSDPDGTKQYQKEYRKKNRKRLSEYALHRYHKDIRRKLKQLIAGGIRKRLQGRCKDSHSIEYIGCTWEFLIGYIEAKFVEGMSWENYGPVWHLDHITPCRAFDFTQEAEIKRCFHYSNLQPLFVVDNLKKLDRLPNGKLARYEDRSDQNRPDSVHDALAYIERRAGVFDSASTHRNEMEPIK